VIPPSCQDATGWHLRLPVDEREGLCADALRGNLLAVWALGIAAGMYPPPTGRVVSWSCWVTERKGWVLFCARVELAPAGVREGV
jgi:hypothetical protein